MGHRYLIDANVFITAHRQIYPFDLAPGFWDQLIDKVADKIIIIEKIQEEILRGDDALSEWYIEVCSNFTILKIPEQIVLEAYSEIIDSINDNTQYKQSAKDEFASIADSWLCAYAMAYNETVVTLESYQAGVKSKVKIPNICKAFNVRCIDLLQFMRENCFKFN